MQIQFTGHHIEITPALRQFTTEKFDRLERHFDQINRIIVVFDVEKLRQIAKATLYVKGGEITASSESEDLYAAIDTLVDKLDGQIIKHKTKLQDRKQES